MKKAISFVFLVASFSCFSQSIDTAKLSQFFAALDKRGWANGSLSISQNGRLIYQRATGFRYTGEDGTVPAERDTRYRIGSQTKMFTAVIIFQMIEEGKLALDKKLSDFYPHYPNAGKITMAHLLSHRSGLHDYTEGTNFEQWMDKDSVNIENLVTSKGADFEPGAKTAYSNSNFFVLSQIIEKVLRMPYAVAVQKRITKKIGQRFTYFGKEINVAQGESRSYKYEDGNWKKVKETDLRIHKGAGGMVSTSADMIKFMEALATYKLVKKESLAKMKSFNDGIGLGLMSYTHDGFGHNGRVEEFYSSVIYFPKQHLAVSYITNGILYPRKDIMDFVLKVCFNEPATIPFSKEIVLAPTDIDKYTGKYTMDPIVVQCSRAGDKLLLETRGKIFEVKPIAENYFMHVENSGYFFEFIPSKGQLLVKETDNVYYLKLSQ